MARRRGRRHHSPHQANGQAPPPEKSGPDSVSAKRGKTARPKKPRDLASIMAYGDGALPFSSYYTEGTGTRYEQVRAFKRWVYVAVDAIASKFASCRPNISYVKRGDRVRTQEQERSFRLFRTARHRALVPLLSHEWMEPAEHNHPLVRLLADPNEPDYSWTLWYETIMYYLLTGSAYWWLPGVATSKLGLPEAIWCLPPHWVWPLVGQKGELLDGWELRPVEGNYLRQVLPASEVIHFRHPNPISKLDGFSPLTAGAQWADVSESIDRSRWHAFKNGTFPTVSVQFDGTLNDPTDDVLRRIEAKFLSRYAGENRSNRPLFLPPGVKVAPLQIKPNEMVWGDNAKETRDNILAMYKVPGLVVGLTEGLSGDNMKWAMIQFYDMALNPLAHMMGQALSEKLCPLYDEQLRCWYEEFTPNYPEHREATIKTDLVACAITPNEIRVMRGREPLPYAWADEPVRPVNMEQAGHPLGGEHTNPQDKPTKPKPQQPGTSDES